MRKSIPLLFLATIFLSSCSLLNMAGGSSKTQTAAVGEDLSRYRGNYSVALELQEEKEKALEEKEAMTFVGTSNPEDSMIYAKDRKFIDRFSEAQRKLGLEKSSYDAFTIQVYRGTSRSTADKVKGRAYIYLEELDLRPVAQWDAPHYKVTVGKFYSKLEAYVAYKKLKSGLPQTTIVPIRISK